MGTQKNNSAPAGWPEKRPEGWVFSENNCTRSWNSAIDACLAVHKEIMAKSVPSVEEIDKVLEDNGVHSISTAIATAIHAMLKRRTEGEGVE